MPLITSDIVIVKRHETNSLTLRYTPTPSSISRFNSYRFSLSDSTKKTSVKEKAVDDADRKIIFEDLVPGRLYEISAWTVAGGVTSHPVLKQDRLYPEPATNINASDISDTELTLSWTAPQGDWSSFEVSANFWVSLNQTFFLSVSFFRLGFSVRVFGLPQSAS